MATITIPRGIQEVRWKNVERQTIVKYRIQIKRKDFAVDRFFDELDDAKLFLEDSKSLSGRIAIAEGRDRASATSKATSAYMADLLGSGKLTVGQAIDLHIEREYAPKIGTPEKPSGFKDKDIRTAKVNRDRLKKIKTILIGGFADGMLEPAGQYIGLRTHAKGFKRRPLGDWPIVDLTSQQTTEFIIERLANKIAKTTIKREIGALQSVVNKLEHYNNKAWLRLQGRNPFKSYDKTKLKGGIKRRRMIINKEDEEKLLNVMRNVKNKQYPLALGLAMLTGLRRAELLALEWRQIDLEAGVIDLDPDQAKDGEERLVSLLPEAIDALKAFPKSGDQLFTLSIEGFKTGWQRIRKEAGLEHINFHDTRRSAVSMMLRDISNSSVVIAEYLGAKSIRNLEETTLNPIRQSERVASKSLSTQEDVMSQVGHKKSQTTQGYTNLAPSPLG